MILGLIGKLFPLFTGASVAVEYPEETGSALSAIKSGVHSAIDFVVPLIQGVPV